MDWKERAIDLWETGKYNDLQISEILDKPHSTVNDLLRKHRQSLVSVQPMTKGTVIPERLRVESKGNVLVIGDTHLPFCHPHYLGFCVAVAEKWDCKTVVHIGDEVDNHAISFHDSDPDGLSAGMEAEAAQAELNKWYRAFPEVTVLVGNHGALPYRQAFARGIPRRYIKTYEEIWQAPAGWKWVHSAVIDGVLYEHGIGSSGKNAALNRAVDNRMSTVIGHVHSYGGVQYNTNVNDTIFGLNVGCGVDANSYAMAYGKPFTRKPTLGCGVVLQGGKAGYFIPMQTEGL